MPTIYCVGKNYAAHVREMGDGPPPDAEPVVFLKPWSARLDARPATEGPTPLALPAEAGEIHHEAEVVLEIGPGGGVARVGLGLDLTDRTRQTAAKRAGLPWATAKGFRGSAPLGPLLPASEVGPLDRLRFALEVGGTFRQRGDTALLLHPVPVLLAHLGRWFGLEEGDLVFTGTPEGVGPVHPGDVLALSLEGHPRAACRFRA